MPSPSSRRIGPLAAAVVLLVVCGSLGTTQICAQQAPQTEAEKAAARAARPSQDAVLAEGSVLKANLPYGEDELQRLDVYAPQGARQAPVVIFLHGGEWTRGDKSAVSYKPKLFNSNGVVLVSVNYRLTPAVTHPAHVSDVAAAIRWVHDHIAEFGGDPDKIVLMGHSAGCQLATLVALDPRYLAKVNLRPADLRGVLAWSGGAYDLVQKVDQGGAYADYIKQAFGDSADSWRDASPVSHAKNGKDGPRFLFVSIEAGNASHQAAEGLAELIRDSGGKAASKLVEGRDHFGANHFLGAPDDTTGAVVWEFVAEVAK